MSYIKSLLKQTPPLELVEAMDNLVAKNGYERCIRALARVIKIRMAEPDYPPRLLTLRKKQLHVVRRCADNLYKVRRYHERRTAI